MKPIEIFDKIETAKSDISRKKKEAARRFLNEVEKCLDGVSTIMTWGCDRDGNIIYLFNLAFFAAKERAKGWQEQTHRAGDLIIQMSIQQPTVFQNSDVFGNNSIFALSFDDYEVSNELTREDNSGLEYIAIMCGSNPVMVIFGKDTELLASTRRRVDKMDINDVLDITVRNREKIFR